MAAIAPSLPASGGGLSAPGALQAVVSACGAAAGAVSGSAAPSSGVGVGKAATSLSPNPLETLRAVAGGSCKLTVDGESKDFTTGEPHRIHPFCEEQGIQFSCIEGTCGTCAVEVKEGADKLNPLTEAELNFFGGAESAGNKRLACQVQINQGASGEVEVEK